MAQEFHGRTTDAEAPYLGAEFWRDGLSVRGTISKIQSFNQPDGRVTKSYTLELEEALVIDGEETERAAIGSLSGLRMAMEAAGVSHLLLKDVIELTCVGVKPAKKEGYNPRFNFELSLSRP
jgi:hypothetical protein